MHHRTRLSILTLILAAFATPAAAQDRARFLADPAPESAPGPLRLELIGGTTAPLDVGISARLVLFDRALIYASAGASAYGELFETVARAYGGDETGDLARNLGNGFFVGRLGIGARPFTDLGLEITAGYALLYRAATLDASFAAALGSQTAATTLQAELAIHAIHVELAWTFHLLEHFVVRPAIGWAHAFAADAALSIEGGSASESATLDSAESALRDLIGRYGMTPTLSLSLGYRF